jgi:hypothetical protein
VIDQPTVTQADLRRLLASRLAGSYNRRLAAQWTSRGPGTLVPPLLFHALLSSAMLCL